MATPQLDRLRALLVEALAIIDGEPTPSAVHKTDEKRNDDEVSITGRIGRPSFQTTKSGLSLWKGGIGYEDENGETVWVNAQAWRSVADTAHEQFDRGDVVTVVGKFTTNTYTNKDGVEQVSDVFTISRFE